MDQHFDTDRDWSVIKEFIKTELKYSYKKGSKRPVACKKEDLIYMQSIFSWRVLKDLHQGKLLVNIDESSYGRSIKRDYSWLPVGTSNPILNINWAGRASVIFGLISNGSWLWMSVDETMKSLEYWIFIMILNEYLQALNLKWEASSIKLLVDNASIHISSESVNVWTYYDLEINSLPPYSPNLAPVEMVFGFSKNLISKKFTKNKINFENRSGKLAIMNSFAGLDTKLCLKLWGELVRQAGIVINEAKSSSEADDESLFA